jgi:hypothetical protein
VFGAITWPRRLSPKPRVKKTLSVRCRGSAGSAFTAASAASDAVVLVSASRRALTAGLLEPQQMAKMRRPRWSAVHAELKMLNMKEKEREAAARARPERDTTRTAYQ